MRHRVDEGFRNVEAALEELVGMGLLEESIVPTGTHGPMLSNYRLNPARTRDIEEILRQYKAL